MSATDRRRIGKEREDRFVTELRRTGFRLAPYALSPDALDALRIAHRQAYEGERYRPDFVSGTLLGMAFIDVKASYWVDLKELRAHEVFQRTWGQVVVYVVPRTEDPPKRWRCFDHPCWFKEDWEDGLPTATAANFPSGDQGWVVPRETTYPATERWLL